MFSRPDAAFLKLQISRESLVRWLDSPAPPTSNWRDWRDIGYQWNFKGGQHPIANVSETELQENIAKCDQRLSQLTNRQVLRNVLDSADAPFLKHAAYDATTREFVAGSITYSEDLLDFLVFLTVARGATAFLGPDGYGIAVIHNYIWGDKSMKSTRAALRLGPEVRSEFMKETEKASAGGAFQSLVDERLKKRPPVDELESLR